MRQFHGMGWGVRARQGIVGDDRQQGDEISAEIEAGARREGHRNAFIINLTAFSGPLFRSFGGPFGGRRFAFARS